MNDHCPFHPASSNTPSPVVAQTLAPDLLRGAEEISEFLFGTRNERRKIYHLAETSKLPLFRLERVMN